MRGMLLVLAAGCNSSPPKPTDVVAPAARGAAPKVPSAPPLASKEFYRLDVGPVQPCTVGAPCSATLVLTALGKHHVNTEYPTKFVAASAPTLGVQAATFAIEGEQRGVLTIPLQPSAAGTYALEGTMRLSVCTADACEIESPKISIPIVAS